MKPSFALKLSHEGIRLFSRATGGWRLVGETDLDTPDLDETLAYLRDKATKLSGSGLSCKLILPRSQILFTSVTANGPNDASRESQIREALRDLTPYDPSDLTFDWRVVDDRVTVAAVANETLQEAETFAVDHRFNPVSFVGDASEATFEVEPFFGATAFSKSFLDKDDPVERDDEAFVIIDKKRKGKTKIFSGKLQESVLLTPAAESKSEIKPPLVPEEDEAPSQVPHPETETDVPSDGAREAESPPLEVSDPQEVTVESTEGETSGEDLVSDSTDNSAVVLTLKTPSKETDAPSDDPPSEDAAEEETPDAEAVPELEAFFSSIQAKKPILNQKTPPIPEHLSKAKGTSSVPSSITAPRKTLTAERDAPAEMSQFVHRPISAGKLPEGIAARIKATEAKKSEKPQEKSLNKVAKGFASSWRRKPSSEEVAAPSFASSRDTTVDEAEPDKVTAGETEVKPLALVNEVPKSKEAPTSEPLLDIAPIVPTPVVSESAATDASPSFEERLAHANITSAEMELPDSEHLSASLGEEAQTAADNDFKPTAEAHPPLDVTVFGARKQKASSAKKPRFLGLILLAALLLVMGLVVLWSMMSPDEEALISKDPAIGSFAEFNAQTQTIIPEARLAPAEPVPPLPVALNTDSAVETGTLALDVETAPEQSFVQPVEQPAEQTVVQPVEQREPDRPAPPTLAQASTAYDDSGIWQRSPALKPVPKIENTDQLYVPSLDPDVDLSDAVALPTAAAIPDDKPLPQQPSPAPAGSTFALGDNGLVVPTPSGTINPDGVLVFSGPPVKRSAPRPDTGGIAQTTDLALTETGNKRPTARPDNLAELREIALLGGRTRDQLARLRPTPRPLSEQITAQTSPEGVSLSTTATKYAVVSSGFPKARPSNFAALVKKAKADPRNVAKPEVAVASLAKKTNVKVSGPKIPTRASVAREATQKNMISLRKVTLIGVYGTPSKRSALVRMGNGKIVEVSVGDRVDGGKVAAIGADEIRYVKGGRNISLKMPPRS